MSIQDAKACMKKLFSDVSFAEKFGQIKSEEEFFGLVKDAGFDFTMEEWERVRDGVEVQARAYAKENNIEISDELTDEQLEAVAGGGALRPIFGSIFGVIGGILGGAAGAYTGATVAGAAGAALTVGTGAAPAAVVGGIIGGAGGAFAGAGAGAGLGDMLAQWIEGT